MKIEGNKHLRKAGKVLELFINDTIPDNTDFGSVKKMVFEMVDKEKIPLVSHLMSSGAFDEDEFEWQHYVSMAARVKHNLRPVVEELDFYSQHPHEPLIPAISFLQASLRANKNLNRLHATSFPQEMIRTPFKPYVMERWTAVLP